MSPAQESLQILQSKVDFLWRESVVQYRLGNRDVAIKYESIAREAEKLVFDVAAMILEKPATSRADILGFFLAVAIE